MMKEEFEALYGKDIDDEEYRVCEYVYTWNPIVTDKKHIVELYKFGGIELIRQLVPNAKYNETEIEPKLVELRHQRDKLMHEVDHINMKINGLIDQRNRL